MTHVVHPADFLFGRFIDVAATPLPVLLAETCATLRQLDLLEREGYVFADAGVPGRARRELHEIEAAILSDPDYRAAPANPVTGSAQVLPF